MKPCKRRAALLLVLLLPLFAVCACAQEARPPLTVTFLKAGKADAIVLAAGDEVMVIDTGEDDDGEKLVEFLQKQGFRRVDVLIITHFDKDHVGGADILADAMELGRVLLPDYESGSAQTLEFMDALSRNGVTPEYLTEPLSFTLGGAEVLVEPPADYDAFGDKGEIDNDLSLVTTVVHGKNRLVFAGDIEKKRIRQWLAGDAAQACTLLKVPHHGVYNAALGELFDALSPKYAVICSSAKKPAEDKTLALLAESGAQVYETKDGAVTAVSDGRALTLHQDTD